jgi:tetratricopeptide (TPR) repeat protein
MTYFIYDVKDALTFFDEKDYDKALSMLLAINDKLTIDERKSAFVFYHIAICYDYLRNHFEAAYWVKEAAALDPLDIAIEASAGVIFNNLEKEMDNLSLHKENSEKVLQYYNYILENGRVKSNTQFIMIRFYMKLNNLGEAKLLLDNALERNPKDKDLVYLRRKIAMTEGDTKTLEKMKQNKLTTNQALTLKCQ